MNVRLGRDVDVDVRLSRDLLVNIWLCWDLGVHIRRWQTSGSRNQPKNNLETSKSKLSKNFDVEKAISNGKQLTRSCMLDEVSWLTSV